VPSEKRQRVLAPALVEDGGNLVCFAQLKPSKGFSKV
jgi:hypothetical protein